MGTQLPLRSGRLFGQEGKRDQAGCKRIRTGIDWAETCRRFNFHSAQDNWPTLTRLKDASWIRQWMPWIAVCRESQDAGSSSTEFAVRSMSPRPVPLLRAPAPSAVKQPDKAAPRSRRRPDGRKTSSFMRSEEHTSEL